MSPEAPVVWVVGSETTVARWEAALEEVGCTAVPLAWSRAVAAIDAGTLSRELAAADPVLVVLTSVNAARLLPADIGEGRPAACVGTATAEAARAAGFDVRLVGDDGGQTLAARIVAEIRDQRQVIWLRGREARPELRRELASGLFEVAEVVTYETKELPGFVVGVGGAPDPSAVVLGSPRAAEALWDALRDTNRVLERPTLVAPGAATAEHAVMRFDWTVVTAPAPGRDGIVSAVRSACDGAESHDD